MKKISTLVLFVLILIITVSAVQAEEYVVCRGETLASIAKYTHHTVPQLIAMNPFKNPNLILPGDKIVFLSEYDLRAAKLWSQKRMKAIGYEVPEEGPDRNGKWKNDYFYFAQVVRDIDSLNIRYSINEPSGILYSIILRFADAWRMYPD